MDPETAARLRAAIGHVWRELRRTAAGHELTPSELSVLATVAVRGPIGLADLAEAEAINPTMLSRILAKLEGRGLLARHPDPDDRRAARAATTPAGAALHLRIRAERTATLADALDALPPERATAVLAALPGLEDLGAHLRGRRR